MFRADITCRQNQIMPLSFRSIPFHGKLVYFKYFTINSLGYILICNDYLGGYFIDLTVYLAGEIHSSWREEVETLAKEKDLPLTFVSPQTDHDLSDSIGENILGEQPGKYYRDDAASAVNNLRTQVLMNKADVVIALFGEEYKQ